MLYRSSPVFYEYLITVVITLCTTAAPPKNFCFIPWVMILMTILTETQNWYQGWLLPFILVLNVWFVNKTLFSVYEGVHFEHMMNWPFWSELLYSIPCSVQSSSSGWTILSDSFRIMFIVKCLIFWQCDLSKFISLSSFVLT